MTCTSPGPQKSVVLPVFHAFTGYDTVSQFAQVGRKDCMESMGNTWWIHCNLLWAAQFTTANIWRGRSCIGVFHYPSLWQDSNMYLYQWSWKASIHTQRPSDVSSYSNQGCLQQHIRWAILQGGHSWASTTVPYHQMPSPADWGRRVSCPDLLKCACRSRCRDFKCVKAHLKCTVRCTYKIDCDNAWTVARVHRQS